MEKILENFRRYINENVGRPPLTLDDAEVLVKLARMFNRHLRLRMLLDCLMTFWTLSFLGTMAEMKEF
mgnify:CR=1 FL=1